MRLPAVLLPLLAAVWLAGAEGVTLAPWAAFATAGLTVAAASWAVAGPGPRNTIVIWLAALTAWVAVAAAWLPVPRSEAAWLVAIGGVASLLAVAAATPAGAAWARCTVVALGAASSCWMVVERLMASGRPGGPVDDPNRAATVVALGLALLPELRASVWLRSVTATLLVAGLVASGSRAALLAIVVAGGVRIVAGASRRVRYVAIAVSLVAASGLALRVGFDRDPLRFERVRIWGVAVRTAVAEMPFGAGPGGYRDAAIGHNFARHGEFARYYRIPSLAENDALQAVASLGLPGLVVVCGLLVTLVRRSWRRPETAGVVSVLAVTSMFHSQLWVPLVAWSSVLAVAAVWGRVPGSRSPVRGAWLACAGVAVAATLTAALMWPRGGLLPDARRWLDGVARVLTTTPEDTAALAEAEADAWKAAAALPRHAEAWRRLGDVRLQRAVLLRDLALAGEALKAYRRASEVNPLDVWALLGEGRAHALLGEGRKARAALSTAVALEPNCSPGWLELSRTELELGEVAAAKRSLARAEAALEAARGASFLSSYERAMAAPDPALLARLRVALGERR